MKEIKNHQELIFYGLLRPSLLSSWPHMCPSPRQCFSPDPMDPVSLAQPRWGRGFPECTAMCASRTSGDEWTPESSAARELENTRVNTAVSSFCPGLWRVRDWSSAHHWPSGSLNPLCAFSFQRSTMAWHEISCRGDTY